MPDINLVELVLTLGFLVLSLGIHEAAHAWVAYLCGDPTAKNEGRMTPNPIVHIDLFWSVLLPGFLWATQGWIFGGAKPVPVIPSRMRNPLRGMMLSALAGPASNFLLAILFLLVKKILVSVVGMQSNTLAVHVVYCAYWSNLALAAFNMIPIPPLDGSRVLAYFLPAGLRTTYVELERFGMIFLFAVIVFGLSHPLVGQALGPMNQFADYLTGGGW